MDAAFGLGAAETIRALLEEAGFGAVRIHREAWVARLPSPGAFTRWVVAGLVLGRMGVQVADRALSAVIHEVEAALHPYVQAEGLAFAMEVHLVVGRTEEGAGHGIEVRGAPAVPCAAQRER